MLETILNIYLIIDDDFVTAFKVRSHTIEGDDEDKINHLKTNAYTDYTDADTYEAPRNKRGYQMMYNQFAKLEKRGMHFQLFEEIFNDYDIPEHPLVCVTPVVDGKILAE